ncbi:hypothetical protein KFK09_027305 [Dendrobium nobile]|uniref:Uncharacterized protein n=1 Tax=Dendrobium nobile TaxID=94219 RepID=A0A8T3AA79_DENNO|nr:hypothetical protein KFK09_027305 [Dendrobium nobile]
MQKLEIVGEWLCILHFKSILCLISCSFPLDSENDDMEISSLLAKYIWLKCWIEKCYAMQFYLYSFMIGHKIEEKIE